MTNAWQCSKYRVCGGSRSIPMNIIITRRHSQSILNYLYDRAKTRIGVKIATAARIEIAWSAVVAWTRRGKGIRNGTTLRGNLRRERGGKRRNHVSYSLQCGLNSKSCKIRQCPQIGLRHKMKNEAKMGQNRPNYTGLKIKSVQMYNLNSQTGYNWRFYWLLWNCNSPLKTKQK